jgi:DNA polymerase III subunit epsilon
MKHRPPFSRFWELYRMGGLTPALSSLLDAESAHQIAYLRSLLKDKREQVSLHTPLQQLHSVVFDLETTGFSPEHGDEIISIGAVALHGNQLVEEEAFYSLVKPIRPIPPAIEELTAITNSMVEAAPEPSQVLIRFFRFVKQRVLIAHGSGHDKKFLNAALRKSSGGSLSHRVLDTMMLGGKLFPENRNFTLDEWLAFYDIENIGRHHALNDAMMTGKLWLALTQDHRICNLETLGDLYEFLGRE